MSHHSLSVTVAIVTAFADGENGGNPAGVVLNADALTPQQKLIIAQQVGLSETAFVASSNDADFAVTFFTPEQQIPHCGHATVATFSYLSAKGLCKQGLNLKASIEGNREIQVTGDYIAMTQPAPTYHPLHCKQSAVLQALALDQQQTITEPVIVSTGNKFLLLGVQNADVLASLQPDLAAIHAISEQHDLVGFYVFTTDTNQVNRDVSTRMFAPRYGIAEESATGTAAGPLACYLYDKLDIVKPTIYVEQGYAMQPPQPSCITVSLSTTNGKITSLMVGGKGCYETERQITLVY